MLGIVCNSVKRWNHTAHICCRKHLPCQCLFVQKCWDDFAFNSLAFDNSIQTWATLQNCQWHLPRNRYTHAQKQLFYRLLLEIQTLRRIQRFQFPIAEGYFDKMFVIFLLDCLKKTVFLFPVFNLMTLKVRHVINYKRWIFTLSFTLIRSPDTGLRPKMLYISRPRIYITSLVKTILLLKCCVNLRP